MSFFETIVSDVVEVSLKSRQLSYETRLKRNSQIGCWNRNVFLPTGLLCNWKIIRILEGESGRPPIFSLSLLKGQYVCDHSVLCYLKSQNLH